MKKLISQVHGASKSRGLWRTGQDTSEAIGLVIAGAYKAEEALKNKYYSDSTITEGLYQDTQINLWDDEYNIMDGPWKRSFESSVKSSIEDSLADVAIALLDLCGALEIDLEKHVDLKMMYNSMRP
jgi:hypothetical protein